MHKNTHMNSQMLEVRQTCEFTCWHKGLKDARTVTIIDVRIGSLAAGAYGRREEPWRPSQRVAHSLRIWRYPVYFTSVVCLCLRHWLPNGSDLFLLAMERSEETLKEKIIVFSEALA